MGLRDEIQADIAEAFDGDLADAVQPFTGTREVAGDYDPVTDTTSTTTVTYTGRCVFGGYKAIEIDGQHIRQTDKRLTVLQNEITEPPQVDDMIDGFLVVDVSQDPASVTWQAQLRRT